MNKAQTATLSSKAHTRKGASRSNPLDLPEGPERYALADAIGHLRLFQFAICGCENLPAVIAGSTVFWRQRWPEIPPALKSLWCDEQLHKPTWARFAWDDLTPEMRDYLIDRAATLGKRAREVLQERPDWRFYWSAVEAAA